MTPAERIAELRLEVADEWGDFDVDRRDVSALLALAEAVPARLARGHNDTCSSVLVDGNPDGYACTCGHDALAAAWAALGGG